MCFLYKTVEDVVKAAGTHGQRATVKPSSCLVHRGYVVSPWHPTLKHVALGPLVLWPMLCQMYNPDGLRVELESRPTVDRMLGEVEAAVRAACGAKGIVLCVVKSSQAYDGVSERYGMKKLTVSEAGQTGRRRTRTV